MVKSSSWENIAVGRRVYYSNEGRDQPFVIFGTLTTVALSRRKSRSMLRSFFFLSSLRKLSFGIDSGSTVVDIGAGTGYYSLWLTKKVGPHGHVLVTNIQPEMLSLLQANKKKVTICTVSKRVTKATR
jgi:predicted methyltransferase